MDIALQLHTPQILIAFIKVRSVRPAVTITVIVPKYCRKNIENYPKIDSTRSITHSQVVFLRSHHSVKTLLFLV